MNNIWVYKEEKHFINCFVYTLHCLFYFIVYTIYEENFCINAAVIIK